MDSINARSRLRKKLYVESFVIIPAKLGCVTLRENYLQFLENWRGRLQKTKKLALRLMKNKSKRSWVHGSFPPGSKKKQMKPVSLPDLPGLKPVEISLRSNRPIIPEKVGLLLPDSWVM